ncbi:MAG: lanthionine synthetase LanC family protein [Bacteroidales bacterium]|nr:lanthionine synthetase LanC family protein [Bacteroidales bacterium]
MRQVERILQDFAAKTSIRLNNRKQLNYSLLGGDLGDIIFLYHYSRIDAHYESIADGLLEKMLRSLSLQPRVATYCNGLAGLGVGLLTLQQDEFISGVDSALGAIDPVISLSLESFIEDNNIDFLHGLIGIGFYLLERNNSSKEYSVSNLSKIVDYLDKSKISDGAIVKWRYNEKKLSKPFNISLSHGVSSIVVFLCRLIKSGAFSENYNVKIKQMLQGAVQYLLSNRVDADRLGCCFASSSIECDDYPHRSRLAWCYGDLGVATALLEAGNTLHDSSVRDIAIQVLLYSARRRDIKANYVNDFCVCHGSVGIAQIFRSQGIALGMKELLDAADYWEKDTLSRVVIDDKGRHTLLYYDPENGGFRESGGILDGIAGAALYLLGEQSHLNKLLLLPWQ